MPKLVVANWKANHNLNTALDWAQQVKILLDKKRPGLAASKIMVAVAPPHPLLSVLAEALSALDLLNDGWYLAVQDMSQFGAGSYTGAVAVDNLQGLPVSYAILGHSERRRYFNETQQAVAQKTQQALAADIRPIICVDQADIEPQLQALQVELSLKFGNKKSVSQSFQTASPSAQSKLDVNSKPNLIFAYEPASAIGSGTSESVDQVQAVVSQIKRAVPSSLVLYGGSVKANNVSQYLAVTDGVLVGSASLQAQNFVDLCRAASADSN